MRITLAWEIGSNYGHVARLAEIGHSLRKAFAKKKEESEFFYIANDPAAMCGFLDENDTVLQAPFHPSNRNYITQKPELAIYTDELRPCGYQDARTLKGYLEAWLGLFELIKPDILITQTAPTAVIAAQVYKAAHDNFRIFSIGNGYDLPPLTSPLSPIRYWEEQDIKKLALREHSVLEIINEALENVGGVPADTFGQTQQADGRYITMFKELDHYPDRPENALENSEYVGPFFDMTAGEVIPWLKNSERRIVAFIHPASYIFRQAIEAFHQLDERYETIICIPGVEERLKNSIEKENVRVADKPLRLDRMLRHCTLGISHATNALSSAMLASGVPQVLLPGTIEQFMLSRAIGKTRAGIGAVGEFSADKIIEMIEKMHENKEHLEAVKAMAKKYRGFKPEKIADNITEKVINFI